VLYIFKIHDVNAFVGGMKTQVEQVTLEILREMEIFSDVEGRHIFHLAGIYISVPWKKT